MIRFDKILLREHGKVDYFLYEDSETNTFWAHIKVPSETVKRFYYDIVFKFTADQSVSGLGQDLLKYNVQFYSNDPSFVFTFAHVFATNNLFIKELAPKMSKRALAEPANEKNPNGDVGYVKTIFFAYLLMKNKGLYKKSRFQAESKPFDLRKLLQEIEAADDKIDARQEAQKTVTKERKKDMSIVTDYVMGNKAGSTMKKVEAIHTTPTVGTRDSKIKSTKSVKRTKRK